MQLRFLAGRLDWVPTYPPVALVIVILLCFGSLSTSAALPALTTQPPHPAARLGGRGRHFPREETLSLYCPSRAMSIMNHHETSFTPLHASNCILCQHMDKHIGCSLSSPGTLTDCPPDKDADPHHQGKSRRYYLPRFTLLENSTRSADVDEFAHNPRRLASTNDEIHARRYVRIFAVP